MMNNLFNISGKVAVVTGGAGTLGSSISECLSSVGVKVVILGRDPANVQREVDKIQSVGGTALPVIADVMDMNQLRNARDYIVSEWGVVDILINTAGGNIPGATIGADQSIFDMNIEDYRKVVDLNLNGTVFPCLVFGKSMAETGSGSIINLSSMSTFSALTRIPGYSMAKSGIEIFTKWLAMELALKFSERIRVNCLAPGFFIAKQNRHILLNPDGSYTQRSLNVINRTPMRRFGRMEELNGTIIYLCSEAASFVTGTVIPVDGGFSSYSGI
jgi:NAD(P)-dependent dehydrogenase (short-subunit alcohol dehydrogenase family)